jgi:GTP-binding protein YchF
VNTEKIVPAIVEFYDIAGLVKGASTGEGLGNQFLSHIREVAAIVHVVRLFDDNNIIHVANKIDPLDDIKTIETELIFADLSTLEKQREPRGNASKEETFRWNVIQKIKKKLDEAVLARNVELDEDETEAIRQLSLLTMKPMMYVFNVSEGQLEKKEETEKKIHEILKQVQDDNLNTGDSPSRPHNDFIYLNAKLETDVLAFSEQEQREYLSQYNLEETGLNRLIKKAYEMLGLISFLTAGEKEVRAWTIKKGSTGPQAAAAIHTDFEKHYIKADVIPYSQFTEASGWVKAREKGLVQIVGKDYVMKDGDVIEFKVGI